MRNPHARRTVRVEAVYTPPVSLANGYITTQGRYDFTIHTMGRNAEVLHGTTRRIEEIEPKAIECLKDYFDDLPNGGNWAVRTLKVRLLPPLTNRRKQHV